MRLISSFVAVLGILNSFASAADPPVTIIAGRNVTLGLLNLTDRSSTIWPAGNSRLVVESILGGPDTNIADILATGGIDPDSGAYTLLYDLNPTIRKLDSIATGTSVSIPKIIASQELQQKLATGSYLVILTIDPQLRQELADATTALNGLASSITALPEHRFNTSEDRKTLITQAQDCLSWYEDIRRLTNQRKGPPTSLDTLSELNGEAYLLLSILRNIFHGTAKINLADQDQISAIHGDLQREIKRYDEVMSGGTPDPDLAPCCEVSVSIVGGDAKDIQGLRVYYTLNGYFRSPPPSPLSSVPFPELGSGHRVLLRPKNYRIWLAPDGRPDRLLSESAVLVEVNVDEKEKKVELLLKRSKSDVNGKWKPIR